MASIPKGKKGFGTGFPRTTPTNYTLVCPMITNIHLANHSL